MTQFKPGMNPLSRPTAPAAAALTPQLARPQSPVRRLATVTGWTVLLMVVLRIFIGWHFFIEGVYKLCQPDWRATSYLVQSAGPLRGLFRSFVKDVDGLQALDPEFLKQRLQARYDKTVAFYGLGADQKTIADNVFLGKQLALKEVDFLAQVHDYKTFLHEIELQEPKSKTTAYERERLQDMYRRKAQIRSTLVAYTDKTVNALSKEIFNLKNPQGQRLLTPEQQAKGVLEPDPDVSATRWIDLANMWGLTAVGISLILGLFTRLGCLGAAGLLAMYYGAMPSLPGLPENPASEGHYLIINKNLIELVAVLMLATTRVGHWGGLDGLLFRRRATRG